MAAVWRMVGAMLLGTTLCTGQHRTIVRVELEMELAEPPPPLCLEAGREYDSLQFWRCRAHDSLQLLRWAHARGYWFARVQVQEDAGAVRYQLHAGEAVRLDSLELRSREPLPEEAAAALHRAARSVRGMVLSWDAVSALLDTLLAVLEEVGYPGAYAELLQARRSAQGAVLEVALDAGAPARLDTLIVEGNQHTRPEFLQRWGGAVPGMVLSRQNVAAVAARLQRLGWLELAAPPRVQQLPDGRWAMWLQVREQPSAVLDGAVGYDQRSGWNGMLRAALQNLLGTGRAVELSWYRAAQRLQELSAAYEEPVPPWLGLRLGYRLRQQDSSYTETLWQLGARAYLQGATGEFALGWREILPAAGATGYAASSAVELLTRASVERLQPQGTPERGYALGVALRQAWQRVRTDSAQLRLLHAVELDAEQYRPLGHMLVLRLHAHVRTLFGPAEPTQFYRVGGSGTLRAYMEAQFWTSQALWGGAELRWTFGVGQYVGLFAEGGYIGRPQVRGLFGYGITGQFPTAAGALQMSLGMLPGEPLRHARVWLGLLRRE